MSQLHKSVEFCLKNMQKVAVGVSGGADSMVLLSLLQAYAQTHSLEIVVVHVEHGVRGEQSVEDARFVQAYCKKYGLPCFVQNVQAPAYAKQHGYTLEQACRELRYKAFESVMGKEHISYLVLAHHADDQLETVLMHICRGSGLKGAVGMQVKQGYVLRPLLPFTKEQLVAYAQENDISYREDGTNQDTEYTRNFIRKHVLPPLQTLYPTLQENIARFSENIEKDLSFIESNVPYKELQVLHGEVHMPKHLFSLPYSLSSRLVYKAFQELQVFQDIEQKHIALVLSSVALQSGSKLDMPWETEVCVGYTDIILRKKTHKKEAFALQRFQVGTCTLFNVEITVKPHPQTITFEEGVHYIDASKIPADAVWRTKQQGDVFQKLGAGTKKLADYFTDKKIERHKRDAWPVLASKENILLVAGKDMSESVKIDAQTEEILAIQYKWLK